ncbi:MAG: heparinase II/III family protein [Planctomycetes bacterium]|nr:heparinase II/III family protein [Planctomycetota bacterium]
MSASDNRNTVTEAASAQSVLAGAAEWLVPDPSAFLRRLDLGRKEFEPVKQALDRDDLASARAATLAWFRTREISSTILRHFPPLELDWPPPPPDPRCDTTQADRILAGHLTDGYTVHDVPPAGLDWFECPLSCLTRFPVVSRLLLPYYHTGRETYLRFIVDHIVQYVHAYPIEEFVGHTVMEGWRDHFHVAKPWYWCMLPCRLEVWTATVALIRGHPAVTDDELFCMLHRIYQEAGYLRTQMQEWVDTRHNAGGAMIDAMARCCVLLDGFEEVRGWKAFNARLITRYLEESFYPDGVLKELTLAYWASNARRMQGLIFEHRDHPEMAAAREILARMLNAVAGLSLPHGRLAPFGDLYAPPAQQAVFPAALEWLGCPWARTVPLRQTGPLPPFKTWPKPGQPAWSGYYSMRSDWSDQARCLLIDGGPWGLNHQHGDKLSFILSAWGADFIIDPTSTSYAANVPDTFISVQPSGFLHNTISIDAVDEYINSPLETQQPLDNTWEQGPHHTLFAGRYSFAPVRDVLWERRVLFIDASYWLLQDLLMGTVAEAQVEQNFQFDAEIEVRIEPGRVIAAAPNQARLVLLPFSAALAPELTVGDRRPHVTYFPKGKPRDVVAYGDYPQQHGRGWTGRGSHRLIPAPAVTWTGRLRLPAILTMAMIPVVPGGSLDELPRIESREEGGVARWKLPFPGGALAWFTSMQACRVESGGP